MANITKRQLIVEAAEHLEVLGAAETMSDADLQKFRLALQGVLSTLAGKNLVVPVIAASNPLEDAIDDKFLIPLRDLLAARTAKAYNKPMDGAEYMDAMMEVRRLLTVPFARTELQPSVESQYF